MMKRGTVIMSVMLLLTAPGTRLGLRARAGQLFLRLMMGSGYDLEVRGVKATDVQIRRPGLVGSIAVMGLSVHLFFTSQEDGMDT